MLPAPYDPAEVQGKLEEGWHGDIAYDVGANMGQSVPWMLQRFRHVHCFEPGDEAYAELKSRFGGQVAVKLNPVALAAHDGLLELAVRQAPIMTGQLVAVGMPYHGEDHGQNTANWGDDRGTRQLQCSTLDSYADFSGEPPDFVKIDTEGHELQVLQGATRTMAKGTTGFLIEFHRDDLHDGCVELLESHGYTVETVRHPHYQPNSGMWYMHGWLRAPAPEGNGAVS